MNHGDSSTAYPICKLHNCTIVDRFPSGCPLVAADQAGAFLEMKDRAWSHLHSEDPSLSEGLHQLQCYEVWSLTNRGQIPHVKVGRAILYPLDALCEWLARRAKGGDRR